MRNINQQLNLGVTPRNTNIVNSGYARSTKSYQVQLGTEDPSLDYYNDIQSIKNMSNADGWDSEGGRDIYDEATELEHGIEEEFDDFAGLGFAYPLCVKKQCKECKTKCKSTQGLRWLKGGKGCYKTCRQELRDEQNARIAEMTGAGQTSAVKEAMIVDKAPEEKKSGLSTGAKVGIGLGALALVGLTIFLIVRKK